MIALGDNGTHDQTEFIIPATQVQVHSRDAAATYLPTAGNWMNWPEHNGRFFNIYGTWDYYLGFFAPNLNAGFTGVYDHTAEQGIVRVFDETQMPGNKFFGPANLEPNLYTIDDSVYVEMWSSGVTPDFWTTVTLGAGQTKSWTERWYPVSQLGTFDIANESGALRVDETSTGAAIGLQVTASYLRHAHSSGRWHPQRQLARPVCAGADGKCGVGTAVGRCWPPHCAAAGRAGAGAAGICALSQ